MSIRAFQSPDLKSSHPSQAQRRNQPDKTRQPRLPGRRSRPYEFGAFHNREYYRAGKAGDQTGTESDCLTRAEPKKDAIPVSKEILPAPKISTIRDTSRNAKGAAAMNLSGSEKKESSASRSPIT